MQFDLYAKVMPVVVLLAISSPGANGQHMNAKDAPCLEAGPNSDVTQCFITEGKTADRELNDTYARILKVLEPADQNKLRIVQRLWVQYRDANCSAERDLYGGGTGGPTTYFASLADETRQRTTELNTIYGWRVRKFGG